MKIQARKPGAGTSTLVCDLAQELSWMGVPALAVEANAFKPDACYGGGPHYYGLVAALAGQVKIEDTILPADPPFPDRIPIGETNGWRHIAMMPHVLSALRTLFYRYDIILLDAPPLELSSDAELLVSLADATVVVAEARGITKSEFKRVMSILERLTPPVVGAVLNRVKVVMGVHAMDIIQEYRSGKKVAVSKWASPWLWK